MYMPHAIQTRQIGAWRMQIYEKFVNYDRIWLFIFACPIAIGQKSCLIFALTYGKYSAIWKYEIFSCLCKKTRKPYLQLDLGVFYKLAQS